MSTPATSFRLFYPESNTLTAAGFHLSLIHILTCSRQSLKMTVISLGFPTLWPG